MVGWLVGWLFDWPGRFFYALCDVKIKRLYARLALGMGWFHGVEYSLSEQA